MNCQRAAYRNRSTGMTPSGTTIRSRWSASPGMRRWPIRAGPASGCRRRPSGRRQRVGRGAKETGKQGVRDGNDAIRGGMRGIRSGVIQRRRGRARRRRSGRIRPRCILSLSKEATVLAVRPTWPATSSSGAARVGPSRLSLRSRRWPRGSGGRRQCNSHFARRFVVY